MNSNLKKIKAIEADKLDGEHYLLSLLDQAKTKGLLSDAEIERMQYECFDLLSHMTERYSAGNSSSIRIEKAQDIMTSNLFTIGLWLKIYANPDEAVTVLQREPITDIFHNGRKHIDTMLQSAKALHSKLMSRFLDTPCAFYRSTIEGGINGFFKLYRPDYAAHEIHITADYPVFNPMPKLAGIEFIHAYLNCLYYENLFCINFASNDIHHLLCGYTENYSSCLINIYELVLLAAIGCTIAETDLHHLDITRNGAERISRLLSGMNHTEIVALMQSAVNDLTGVLDCPRELVRYIQNSLPSILSRVELATRDQVFRHVFVLPSFPEDKPELIFSNGDKMEDEQYRKLIEELLQCSLIQDKMAIIKECVHSLADLEDILLDAELSGEEMHSVLRELSLPELAAITKRHPQTPEIDMIDLREQEQTLRESLYSFISGLPKSERDIITRTIGVLHER